MIVVSSYWRFALTYALQRVSMSTDSEIKCRIMLGYFLRSLRLWSYRTAMLMTFDYRHTVMPDGISPPPPFASQQVLHL